LLSAAIARGEPWEIVHGLNRIVMVLR